MRFQVRLVVGASGEKLAAAVDITLVLGVLGRQDWACAAWALEMALAWTRSQTVGGGGRNALRRRMMAILAAWPHG